MKKIMFFSIITLFSFAIVAQELPNVIPPSPESQAFEKYGNIPVSTYTGVPNINIPLYTIQQGDIKVPISLSYHASGIKVDQEASTVGLGWVLNAGGIISRTIYGDDDFLTNYDGDGKPYINDVVNDIISDFLPTEGGEITPAGIGSPILSDCYLNINGYDVADYLGTTTGYSFQPDLFNYNFQGINGKFVLKRNGEAFLAKDDKIEITANIDEAHDDGFTIRSADGKIYDFKKGGIRLGPTNLTQWAHSWVLEKITSPTSGRDVSFKYSDFNYNDIITTGWSVSQQSNRYSRDVSGLPGDIHFEKDNYSNFAYEEKYLDHIDFDNGRVVFEYQPRRLDLEGAKSLKSIKVYQKSSSGTIAGNPIKEFQFEYEYFNSFGGYETINSYPFINVSTLTDVEKGYINKRLKLKKVHEVGKPEYIFSYYNEYSASIFAGKGTYSKDHWGYLNAGSGSLIPTYTGVTPLISGPIITLSGGNRSPDPGKISIFSLKDIQYPTKGRTEFIYEPHSYDELKSLGNNFSNYRDLNKESDLTTEEEGHLHTHTPDNGDGLEKETSFTIPSDNGDTYVAFESFLQCSNTDGRECHVLLNYPDVYLETPDGIRLNYDNLCANGANQGPNECTIVGGFTVGPGTYTIKSRVNSSDIYSLYAIFSWEQNATPDPISYGGGQRIKEIRDYDGLDPSPINIKTMDYHYTDPETGIEKTHGLLMAKPLYEYTVRNLANQTVNGTDNNINTVEFWRGSTSKVSLSGNPIGYSQVTVSTGSNGELGSSTFHFRNQPDIVTGLGGFRFDMPAVSFNSNGLLERQEDYNADGGIVKELENVYTPEPQFLFPNSKILLGISKNIALSNLADPLKPCFGTYLQYPALMSNWIKLESTTEKIYDYGSLTNGLVSTTNYEYGPSHKQLTKKTTTKSDGNIRVIENQYAEDLNHTNLIDNHMHSQVLWNQQKVGTTIMSTIETDYAQTGLPLPLSIEASKGTNPLSERIVYHDYDNQGNPLEVSKADGPHVYYVWGYNGQYPMAKIENLESSQVTSAIQVLMTSAETVSEADDDRTVDIINADGTKTYIGNEGSLREALDELRAALPDLTMISTYTYDPLIGLTSVTDPRGYTMYYEYDTFNRLKEIKDADNLLIEDYEYHYKTQD